jgi:hypothetical protein
VEPGQDWWPNDYMNTGYYASKEALLTDGLIDPSNFIDSHRSEIAIPAEVLPVAEDTTEYEIECLATALMSEASIGTNEERIAVAWTIFNRVDSPQFPNTVCEVVYQGGQYATNQEPTQEILDLATSLVDDPGTDPTGGATHFFSPIIMPKEGGPTRGYDVGGGLHEVAGITEKVYFPSWTLTMEIYPASARHIICSIESKQQTVRSLSQKS